MGRAAGRRARLHRVRPLTLSAGDEAAGLGRLRCGLGRHLVCSACVACGVELWQGTWLLRGRCRPLDVSCPSEDRRAARQGRDRGGSRRRSGGIRSGRAIRRRSCEIAASAQAHAIRRPAAHRSGQADLAARPGGVRPVGARRRSAGSAACPGRGIGRCVVTRPGAGASAPDFATLPDLASRRLGGGVVFANDELFAEKENLIKPEPPQFSAADFGNKGKVYDGWETRRRREAGNDYAIVRLGIPGVVRGVVVDTAFFRGNFPPQISIEAVNEGGYPSGVELAAMNWEPLVQRSAANGDAANAYPVPDRRRWTHVRLSIYPDGGVARLRVHGEPVPDPAFLTGTIDLAAMENGGRVTGCSNAFYSSPEHLIMPGLPKVMSDGWENARRRDNEGDYVTFRLAGVGLISYAEIDTSYFVGNAPGWIKLSAATDQPSDSRRELL